VIYEPPDTLCGFGIDDARSLGDSFIGQIVQLFTTEEAMTAMIKTGQLQKSYRPPTAA
jgi:hypothetical protein